VRNFLEIAVRNTLKSLSEWLVSISVLVSVAHQEWSLAQEWRTGRNLWNPDWYESEYGMLECWNSGGCAGLGNLHILAVVVMVDDSNMKFYKG